MTDESHGVAGVHTLQFRSGHMEMETLAECGSQFNSAKGPRKVCVERVAVREPK